MIDLLVDGCFWIAMFIDVAVLGRLAWEMGNQGGVLLGNGVETPTLSAGIAGFFAVHLIGLAGPWLLS